MPTANPSASRAPRTRRNSNRAKGFTLIELLVVIVIIVILVGLLVPALSGARKAAKKAATRSNMQSFLAACAAFKADKQRQPGVVPTDFLGMRDNDARQNLGFGLTMMQSAIIDLAGGAVRSGANVDVDPGSSTQVLLRYPFGYPQVRVVVDHTEVGRATGPQYINLSKDAYSIVAGRINGNQELKVDGAGVPVANSRPLAYIPELIDGDGMPVLMWQQDPLATEQADFAKMFSVDGTGTAPGATPRPRFAWAANSGVLTATRLGPGRVDQAQFSLLGKTPGNGPSGGGGASNDEILSAMTAMLGNTMFSTVRPPPTPETGTVNTENPQGIVYPTAPKGEIVLHAAGPDRQFLARPVAKTRGSSFVVYSPTGTTNSSGNRNEFLPEDFDDFTEAQ